MANEDDHGGELSIIADRTIPDFYSDSVRFRTNFYGVTVEFGQAQQPSPSLEGAVPHVVQTRVRMSPQHAKIMAMVFRKNMRLYEEQFGQIVIPPELVKNLGLEDEV